MLCFKLIFLRAQAVQLLNRCRFKDTPNYTEFGNVFKDIRMVRDSFFRRFFWRDGSTLLDLSFDSTPGLLASSMLNVWSRYPVCNMVMPCDRLIDTKSRENSSYASVCSGLPSHEHASSRCRLCLTCDANYSAGKLPRPRKQNTRI